ncbi:DUF427 domain-containing protein [Aureimonas sp. AU20]|uniref:DUF427 domain-containing protein n=1 Tax=Aureimonas sp. AU20 TaxID=1349819 RepID=UPI0007210ECE|nr:DUF427 domain-containing protein [Aureimonas sp. AU20]ALN71611.1 hypothetical protein M673_02730 [Aureimonas sp. AU20]
MSATDRIRIEREPRAVQVLFHDAVIASTKDALKLIEAGHEPVYYIPRDHAEMAFLQESDKRTTCPYKGEARYWSISAEGYGAENAVWSYDQPKEAARAIAGHLAFYPDKVRIAVAEDR